MIPTDLWMVPIIPFNGIRWKCSVSQCCSPFHFGLEGDTGGGIRCKYRPFLSTVIQRENSRRPSPLSVCHLMVRYYLEKITKSNFEAFTLGLVYHNPPLFCNCQWSQRVSIFFVKNDVFQSIYFSLTLLNQFSGSMGLAVVKIDLHRVVPAD